MDFEQFGKYVLLHKIAVGGMAEVFLAKHSDAAGQATLVVIKRLLAEHARDEEYLKLFTDEARLASAMSHPNLAQVFDFGSTGDRAYIAMEYIAGQNLARIIKNCRKIGMRLPFALTARVLMDACNGLHYAHTLKDASGARLNVVHRDVSPGNLLVSYSGVTKVLDFGVAKAESQLARTAAGKVKGTYNYMAPEQIEMAPLDARVDVWALGTVLWEALTLQRLFDESSQLALADAILQNPIPSPTEVVGDVPPALASIAMRALSRERTRRFSSAQLMRTELEAYLHTQSAPSSTSDVAFFVRDLFGDQFAAHQNLVAEGPQASAGRLSDLLELDDEVTVLTVSGIGKATDLRVNQRRRQRRLVVAASAALGIALALGTAAAWLHFRPARAPKPLVGTLRVETVPPGARIFIDEQRYLESPLTIADVTASVEHAVVAAMDGYESAAQKIAVAPGVENKVVIVLNRKVEQPTAVALKVNSTPSGARVVRTDSGELLGLTPLAAMLPVSERAIELRLELAGYRPVVQSVSGQAGSTLEVTLTKVKARPVKKRSSKRGKRK